ncbi:MAG: DUF11 domain-containing protein [Hyphomicrobiaceae bacterium]|nr:DUF11 domain-containing protein [Hyphomicrobiaceae bacterium]
MTLGAAAFDTQFTATLFQIPGNRTLAVGNYCTTVTSSAPDVQSKAFFIKGVDLCQVLSGTGGSVTGVTCSTTPPSSASPSLSVAKAAPSPALAVGVQSTYAITVTNAGAAAASTAQVKDQLPVGMTFGSATGTNWVCANASGLITCNFSGGSIAATSGTSVINVAVTPTASLSGQSVTNYASVDPTGGSSAPTPGASCTPTTSCTSVASTVSAPSLTITTSAPSPALVVGSQSTYTLTVVNGGSAATSSAKVFDQLPAGLTFVSTVGSATGWSCGHVNGLLTCNFSGGSIAANGGSTTIQVVVLATATVAGQNVTNYASIDPTGGSNTPVPGPTCATVGPCTSIANPVGAPSLSIAKAAPSPGLEVGAQSSYILTVSNNGNVSATSAQVKDQLPTSLTFVSASGTGWSCSNASGLVSCNFSGTLPIGVSSTINVVVSTNQGFGGQSITNHASIGPTGGTSAPAPGPSCTTLGSCASVAATVSNSKAKTEAIIQNFLTKRGDRLATNGLELNRLVDRLSDECSDDRTQNRMGVQPSFPLSHDSSGVRKSADAPFARHETQRPSRAGNEFARSSLEFDARRVGTNVESEQQAKTGEFALGPAASGTNEQGRMSLSGSLTKARAINRTKNGLKTRADCVEHKRISAFDIWFEGTYEFFNYAHSKGHFGLIKFGADYKVAPGLLVGVMAQFDSTHDKSSELGYLVKGNGWLAGPYAAMRLGESIYFDARLLKGSSDNAVAPDLTYQDNFSSERWLAAARISGRWNWNGLSVTPSVEYVHFADKSSSYVDTKGITIGSQRVDISRLIFGPEFRHTLPMRDDYSINFHVAAKGLWDLNPLFLKSLDGINSGEKRSDFHARVDLGVAVQSQSGISAGVGVGLEGLGGDGYSSRSVTGTLKIPLQ